MGVGYGSTTITNISGGVVSMYGSAKYTQDQVSTMCQNGSQNWAVESVPSDLHVGDTVYIYVYLPNSNVIGCAVTGMCDVINSATSIHIVTPRFVPLLGESIAQVTNYYLATDQSSGVTRSTSGWTTTIQSMDATNQYLWNYEVTTGSNGSTINTTDPIIIGRFGQDGGAGKGISDITEYYLASNLSSGVTTSDSGWTTTVQTTDRTKRYLWNFEVITYTTGTPYTSDPRIIGTYGDTGDNFIWNNFIGTYTPDVSSTDKRPKIYGQSADTATNVNNCSVATHGFRVTNTGASRLYIRFGNSSTSTATMNGLIAGHTYTLSFDAAWKVCSSSTGTANTSTYYMRTYLYTKTASASSFSNVYTNFATVKQADKGTDMTGRCEYTFTLGDDCAACYILIQCTGSTSSHYASGDYIELSNLMLCEDDKAQPWSPHPTEIKGEDGFTPTVTASKSGDTTTITIVNKTGTTTQTISDGARGATWYAGTSITGTSTADTVFSGSGVESAIVGDHYLNTSTQNVYVCTLGGAASVAKWKYEQNIKGEQGVSGGNGSNAYFHVKYSNDGGTTFTGNNGEDAGIYIGTYADNTASDSSNVSDYTWVKIEGADGGRWYSGTAITGTSTTPAVYNTGISSAVVGDMYLNTTTYNTYRCALEGDASTAKWAYVNNIKGVGISAVVTEYYLSTSSSSQTGGSWSTTPAAYVSGSYYWKCDKITWTEGSPTYTTAVLDNALNSANSTAYDANEKIDNLEIGGTNLLPDSNAPSFSPVYGTYARYISDSGESAYVTGEFSEITDPPVVGIKYGYKLKCTTAKSSRSKRGYAWNADTMETLVKIIPGETYTLSCYVRKISGTPYINMNYGYSTNDGTSYSYVQSPFEELTSTTWKHISYTFTYSVNTTNRGSLYPIELATDSLGEIEACGFKFEKGNKATQWSLSPIDTAITVGGTNLVDLTTDEWVDTIIVDGSNRPVTLFGSSAGGYLELEDEGLSVGDRITVSFDIKFSGSFAPSGTGTANMRVQGSYDNPTSWHGLPYVSGKATELVNILNSTSREGHIVTYFFVTQDMLDGTYTGKSHSNIRFDYYTGVVSIRRVMVERGNRPSSWSPSPNDIARRALEAEIYASYPNLSPFFSATPYSVGDYWRTWGQPNIFSFTSMGDGWIRVQATNTGSGTVRSDPMAVRTNAVKPGELYTFLVEFRNNHSTGTGDNNYGGTYFVQTANSQFWGNDVVETLQSSNATGGGSVNFKTDVPPGGSGVYTRRVLKRSEGVDTIRWDNIVDKLVAFTFQVYAGGSIDVECRLSVYPGRYMGPYKPYDPSAIVEDVQLGGRNLLRNTRYFNENWYSVSGITFTEDPTEKVMIANWPAVSTAAWRDIRSYGDEIENVIPYSTVRNKMVTLSFWFKTESAETTILGTSFQARFDIIKPQGITRARYTPNMAVSYLTTGITQTTDWQRGVITFLMCDQLFNGGTTSTAIDPNADYLAIQIYNYSTVASHVKKLKLEIGTVPTDWSEAPEDMYLAIQTSADGKNKNVYAAAPFEDPADWPTAGFIAGDVWWDPTDGYKMYEFDGYEWKAAELDTPAFKAGSIKAGVIDAGAVTADKIAAHAVTANKISIGDFTNLATVNENYPETMHTSIISGKTDIETISDVPYIKKYDENQLYLMFNTDKSPCVYRTDDEFYYEFIAHADTALSAKFIVWGYGFNGVCSEETSAFSIGTTDSKITGTIKLTQAEWSNVNSIIFGLSNISSSQVYAKNIIIRKKDGGELIVDGSITANKIAAGTITGDKLNISDVISVGSIATQEDVNSIQVGGRNLIVNTFIPVATPTDSRPHLLGSTIGCTGRGTCTTAEHGLRFTINTDNVGNWQYFRFGSSNTSSVNSHLMGLEPGETYTYSFDIEYKLLSGRSETSTDLRLEAQLWATLGTSTSFGRRVYQTIHEYKASDLTDRGVVITDRVEFTFTVPETATRLYIDVKMANTDIKADYLEGDYIELQNLKLEKGNRATDYTPATEDLETSMSNGRNLIKNTLNPVASPADQRPCLIGQIANTSGRHTCTVAEHGLRFTLTSANWQYIFFGSSSNSAAPDMLGLEPGETYTFSCDASWKLFSSTTGKDDATTYYFGAMLWYSTTEGTGSFTSIGDIDAIPITQANKGTNMSGRIEFTFTVPLTAKRLYFGIKANNNTGSHYAVGDYIEARNLKMEKGTRATAYTPAPEDMIAEEQIIYCQAASNTSPTSPGSTWITSTSESVVSDEEGQTPTWTTKRPTYRRNYPFLFTAKQSRTSGETVITGTITRDDTTTIIDGGHIITGSIDADKIAANAITANKIHADALNGKTITGGTYYTTYGDCQYYDVYDNRLDTGTTQPASPEQMRTRLTVKGLANQSESDSVWKSHLIPCFVTPQEAGAQSYLSNQTARYGWFANHFLYSPVLITDKGIVPSEYQVTQKANGIYNTLWDDMVDQKTLQSGSTYTDGSMPTGITAVIKPGIGIVTLAFTNFSFPASTTTTTEAYRLPTRARPCIDQDLMSTINSVRFKITTDGYIRPFTATTASTTIRGTFTFQSEATVTHIL